MEDWREAEALDDGVDQSFRATESFDVNGEHVDRQTRVDVLDDGGVHLTQKTATTIDSLTLSAEAVRHLNAVLTNDD